MKEPPNPFRALLFLVGSGSFLLWGTSAAIPLLRLEFGISRTLASAHNIAIGLGAVLGARFAVTLLKMFGRQHLTRAMILVMFLGVIAFVAGPNIWITIPGCGLAFYAQTTYNTLSLAQIAHDKTPSLRRMLLQTAIQAGVGGTSIFLISASLHADLGWRLPIFVGAMVLSPLSLLVIWHVKFLDSPSMQTRESQNMKISKLNYQVVLLGVTVTLLESGVSFWAIDLLISRGAALAVGAFGSALLGVGMSMIRVGTALSRLKANQLMIASVALLLSGILTVCLVHSAGATMIGLVIAGSGTAPLFAAGIFQVSEGRVDAESRIAQFMMGSSISLGLAPFALAAIVDNAGFVVGYAMLSPIACIAYFLWRSLGHRPPLLHGSFHN